MSHPTSLLFIGGLSAGHPHTQANPLGLHPEWVGPAPNAVTWLRELCSQGDDEIEEVMLRQPAGNYAGQPVSFSHGPCTCGEARWGALKEVASLLATATDRKLALYCGGWPVDPCSLVHDPGSSWRRDKLSCIEGNLRPWASLGVTTCGVDASSRGAQDRVEFTYCHEWCRRNLGIGLQYESIPERTGGVPDWEAIGDVAGAMAIMASLRKRLFGMPPTPPIPPWTGDPPIPMWKRFAWECPSDCRAIALVAPGDGISSQEAEVLRDLDFEFAWRNAPVVLP